MTELDREINIKIMQELGLEPNAQKHVIDQDTGAAIVINGMPVLAPGYYNRNSIEFDPYNSRKMMSQLFGHFLDKYSDENGVNVLAFYNVDGKTKDSSGSIACKFTNNQSITSKPYRRETLKYVDIIMQLNGDTETDLSKYDIVDKPQTIKNKRKKG